MAKSTVNKALASLEQKFHAKIREVGALRRELTRLTANSTTPDEDRNRELYEAERTKRYDAASKAATGLSEIQRLQNVVAGLKQDLSLSKFEVDQAAGAYRRLSSHVEDIGVQLKDARSDAKDWRSYSAIGTVLGMAVGALAAFAYIAQTAPL